MGPSRDQAGRLGRRGGRLPRHFRVPLRRRQHGHRRRAYDNSDAGAAWVWTGAEESGPSRDPSWSARAPWGLGRRLRVPPPTASRPSSEVSATAITLEPRGSSRADQWRRIHAGDRLAAARLIRPRKKEGACVRAPRGNETKLLYDKRTGDADAAINLRRLYDSNWNPVRSD